MWKNASQCRRYGQRIPILTNLSSLPRPSADDFASQNPVLPDHARAPHSPEFLLISLAFLLGLRQTLFEQQVQSGRRVMLPPGTSATLDVDSYQFLPFGNP